MNAPASNQEDIVLRVVGHLTILLLDAVRLGRIQVSDQLTGDMRLGRGEIHRLFDMFAEAEIGELVVNDFVEGLLHEQQPEAEFIVLDLAGARVQRMSAQEVLDQQVATTVGMAVFRAFEPEWIFYRPLEFHYYGERLYVFNQWLEAWS